MADAVELPEGQEQFKLGEVCKLAEVQPYMLRFWGTEFAQLKSDKNGTGQRVYTRDQVETILEIRRLLFDEGLTIAGARKRIAAMERGEPEPARRPRKRSGKRTRKTAAEAAEASARGQEVDNTPPERVKPLVAALRDARTELSQIVAELRKGS